MNFEKIITDYNILLQSLNKNDSCVSMVYLPMKYYGSNGFIMKYSIFTLLSILFMGCKAQQLSFEKVDLKEEMSGIEGGKSSYTFTLTTRVKEKSIGEFTKLWYHNICYSISQQKISREGEETTIVLLTQDPPRGFRSSKSPIKLTTDVQLVVEHVKDTKVEHLAIGKVIVQESISYPSAPPSE